MILPNNHPIQRIGIGWQLSQFHGWGVFGTNLALSLVSNGFIEPKLLNAHNLDKKIFPTLSNSLDEWEINSPQYSNPTQKIQHSNLCVIHAFGNDFSHTNPNHWGEKNIGFIFFENTSFSYEGLKKGHSMDLILTGSRWNAEILRDIGFRKVAYVMQGVDTNLFESIQRKVNPNKFTIFSGGKLEFRKGQDIVLAAFTKFYKRHPDSQLITAWNNPWPKITQNLANSPHQFGTPNINNNQVDIQEWCSRSGLPNNAFLHLGFIPNIEMAKAYSSADVGLFPNRAEGGTNLVAMEAMAAGVPCILSSNTGHLDLITNENCIALKTQTPYSNIDMQGWGESNVDEIVENLEICYANRGNLAIIGDNAKNFINQFSWKNQTNKLINLISDNY